MVERLIRYLPDTTGENDDNLVKNEYHKLDDRRFKCMTLKYGAFYVDTVEIYTADNKRLIHNKDYVYADIMVDESEIAGATIACVLIITNYFIGDEFIVTYRNAGLAIREVTKRTVALLEAPDPVSYSDSWIDLRNKPKGFKPTFHYHKLSDIAKFELMLFYTERIRNAILFDTGDPLFKYATIVDRAIQNLTPDAISNMDSNMILGMEKFRQDFSKGLFGLENITNTGAMTIEDAYQIGTKTFASGHPEGMLLLNALIAFKNGIYQTYVGSDYTTLGKNRAHVIEPLLAVYMDIKIGATVVIDSYSNNSNKNIKFDRTAYPTVRRTTSSFNIKKITQQSDARAILTATDMRTNEFYVGTLVKNNVGFMMNWRQIIEPDGISATIDNVTKHLVDFSNPHRDTKDDVDLGKVENLPLADMYDLITDSDARKYVTWNWLAKFTRRFLSKQRPNKTEKLQTVEENLMKNISVVFSPCGEPCTMESCKVLDVETTTTSTTTTTLAPVETVYEVTVDKELVKAKDEVTFTIKLIQGDPLTNVYWEFTGEGYDDSRVDYDQDHYYIDLVGPESFVVTIKKRKESKDLKNFKLELFNAPGGQLLAESPLVNVKYEENIYTATADKQVVKEDERVVFTLTIEGDLDPEEIRWQLDGISFDENKVSYTINHVNMVTDKLQVDVTIKDRQTAEGLDYFWMDFYTTEDNKRVAQSPLVRVVLSVISSDYYLGFWADMYDDLDGISSNTPTSLDMRQRSPDSFVESRLEHDEPYYLDKEGMEFENPFVDPNQYQGYRVDWHHMNLYTNRFFSLYENGQTTSWEGNMVMYMNSFEPDNQEIYSLYTLKTVTQSLYTLQTVPQSFYTHQTVAHFKIDDMNSLSTKEAYFYRTEFEIIGWFDPLLEYGTDMTDEIPWPKCEQFVAPKPYASIQPRIVNYVAQLQKDTFDFSFVQLKAEQLQVNGEWTNAMKLEIIPKNIRFPGVINDNGEFVEYYPGESANEISLKIRMRFIRTDKPWNQAPNDIETAFEVDFTLAVQNINAYFFDWIYNPELGTSVKEMAGTTHHTVIGLLNFTPSEAEHDVQHFKCDPIDHDLNN